MVYNNIVGEKKVNMKKLFNNLLIELESVFPGIHVSSRHYYIETYSAGAIGARNVES